MDRNKKIYKFVTFLPISYPTVSQNGYYLKLISENIHSISTSLVYHQNYDLIGAIFASECIILITSRQQARTETDKTQVVLYMTIEWNLSYPSLIGPGQGQKNVDNQGAKNLF